MMLLPNGQVVYAQSSAQISLFTGDATASVTAPAITSAPAQAQSGGTFQLGGTGFNGVSAAVSYGDDASSATNYPLVRLTNAAGNVTYARTHDHSSMGVATGASAQTTMVTLPSTLAAGSYQMVVVANAVPSAPVTIQVAAGACTGCVDAAGACQAGTSASACGSSGNACVACVASQSCTNGTCVNNACTGCVDAAGACQAGTSASACGSSGNACVACGANQTCTNGACVNNACTGCVDAAGACQAGTSASACGSNGNACVACGASQSCTNGTCVNNACTGCVDAAGACQAGTSASACGSNGSACVACGASQSCANGACVDAASCAHPICSMGSRLVSGCDPCATQICASDSYCCATAWDSICVGEVSSICQQSCGGATVCAHAVCAAGAALQSACDPCAAKICASDSYCCSTSWDSVCVGEVASICGQTC
jgi:hypothetical protein